MTDAAAVAAVRGALAVIPHGATVVLGVSGGGDSTALAHLVVAARPDLRADVVHIRHGLRPDAADAEVAARHAEALGLRFEAVGVSVASRGTGPEDAARQARMTALAAAARARNAAFVLVGHTADDQAETVLLNIARGSGLPGLAGMRRVRVLAGDVRLVRPLLDVRRETVRAVAAATGLPIATDPTNSDPHQRRSRARHGLLPLLAGLTGAASDPVASLARLAAHARADTEALDAVAGAALAGAVATWGPAAIVATDAVDGLPAAIGSRVIRGLVAIAAPGPPPSEATVATVLGLRDGRAATLAGGLTASRGGGCLAVSRPAGPLPQRRLDGAVDLPELGVALERTAGDAAGALPPWAPATSAPAVPVEAHTTVVVRSRRSGDRIMTAAGTQSIADAMIGAGVPRVVRDLVPVICDETGPLWVPGVAVRAGARGSLRLRLAPLGGK